MAESPPQVVGRPALADDDVELRKEAFTMALYVAICLLAALAAVAESTAEDHVFEIVWGTTVGLALAHWLAFGVSARLVAAGHVRRHDAQAAVAQLLGAAAVALLATVPVIIFPRRLNSTSSVRLGVLHRLCRLRRVPWQRSKARPVTRLRGDASHRRRIRGPREDRTHRSLTRVAPRPGPCVGSCRE